ncbi:vanadium-dependent haloperoxidase [Ramlibacter sp. USB13]|uniref:Vanadium-dependent haloperoxidase n=1 Tax=Ramlibacter cellulosilyticus TaxID=2764187 RepID=A0A923S926_9BURK|nr:vanadium-dependent haloperoxidase [Ramlibacter cellulosilyticus]MBC5781314.1 vanadium-dependent haloperoxidase [Ramlibacter cellulosilyticus]
MKKTPFLLAAAAILHAAPAARADAVTDWNTIAGDLVVQSKMGTPPAVRVMAIVQTAVHEAVAAAQLAQPDAPVAADAAVAAANRTTLVKLLPQQEAAITTAYRAALDKLADGPSRSAGIAAGEQAASRVLAWRADDGAGAPERYRPQATPGTYVPTAAVATPQWPQRKPWLLQDAAQFRPAPPPALGSAQWARDYNEVKALGAKASTQRTPEQTEVARFWEYSLPPIYYGVARSVALAPGRTVAQNARLFAATSQAMDDALIAVMDAKYHYGFWRPVTAIRNGDRDGNPATDVEHGWAPFIDNPGHPEYPSAHSILAGAVGELVKAEVGDGEMPELSSSSPSANGGTRRWKSPDAFVQEVADARVWEGIHFRTSTEVGAGMGRRIGALAATRVAQAPATAAVPQAPAPRMHDGR